MAIKIENDNNDDNNNAYISPFLASHQVYVWGRRNENVRLTFLNLFPFTAPYLPWVLLTFSVLLGNPPTIDIIGIIVGHTYYFLEFVYPVVAESRGWKFKKVLVTPNILHYLCGSHSSEDQIRVDVNFHDEPVPPLPPQDQEHEHQE